MPEDSPSGSRRIIRVLEWVILGLGLVGILWLWDAHGISWDEHIDSQQGELALSYFRSLGSERSLGGPPAYQLYTAFPDMVAAAWYQFWPQWKFAIRHTVSAVFALATVPALFRYSRLMGEPWAGPLASLFVLTMPVFFGHAFVNSKDIPMAAAFAWGMLALAWIFQEGRFTRKRILVAGLGLGFSMAIRPGASFMVSSFVLAAMLYCDVVRSTAPPALRGRRPVYTTPALLAVAWVSMVAVWPWAHENPLVHPVVGIWAASAFPNVVPVLFDGRVYPSDALPPQYLAQMLALKTPSAVLLLALVGLGWGSIRIWSDRGRRGLSFFIAALWLLAPLGAWTILTPSIYDGFRHFLFVLPALGLWAAVGALRAFRTARSLLARAFAGFLLLGVIVVPISDIVRLHPYEMTYFNRWVGSVSGAAGRYETDYWVTSYREAAEWVARRSTSLDRPVRVLIAGGASATAAASVFLPSDAIVESLPGESQIPQLPSFYDYYISTTRNGWDRNFPSSQILHSIGRGRAVFTVVKGRDDSDPEPHG